MKTLIENVDCVTLIAVVALTDRPRGNDSDGVQQRCNVCRGVCLAKIRAAFYILTTARVA